MNSVIVLSILSKLPILGIVWGGLDILTKFVYFIGQAIVYAQHPDKTKSPSYNVNGSLWVIWISVALIIIAGGFNV